MIRAVQLVALLISFVACGGADIQNPEARDSNAEVPETFQLPNGDVLTRVQIDRYSELMAEAGNLYDKGDYAGCAKGFEAALAIQPSNEQVRYFVASCLSLDAQRDRALEFVVSAVDLGYWRPSVLEEDDDVAAIRDDPRFEAALAKARELEAALEASNPLEGISEPGGPYESLAALEEHFDEAGDLGPLSEVLGGLQRRQLTWKNRRDRIYALRDLSEVASQEGNLELAAEARLAALDHMTRFDNPGPWLDAEVDRFLGQYGDSPYSGAALLLQASVDFEEDDLWDDERERYPEALAAMEAVALEVVARYPEGEGSRDAYLWLLRGANHRFDNDTVVKYYGKLKERWGEDEEFWEALEYEMTGPRLMAEGLPDFEVQSIDGETLSLASLRGKVTLLDFWATWCGPCVRELPNLKQVYAKHHEQGFEVVGISADETDGKDLEQFREWLTENEISWPQFYDGTGWENEVHQAYGIVGVPTTVLIDRQGHIAAVDLRGERLARKVAELL